MRARQHLLRRLEHEHRLPEHPQTAATLLPDGHAAGDVAVETGFYDQSHLTRHFRRIVGVSPGRFARHGPHGTGLDTDLDTEL